VIGLTGGPGQAGVMFADGYDYILPTAGRDLVMIDQRGTGGSGLLRCPSLDGSGGFSAAAAACGRRLGVRRSFYTSADSAADLEALRIRLGVPRIALFAVSYGTRVAVEYARRYPQRVERMILDSPVGIGALDPLARETLGAVPRVLRTVCREGCGAAAAHPVSDMARLVARLRRSPIRRVLRRGTRTARVSVVVDDLLGMLLASDLDPELMRRIPPAVRAAVHGDSRPLVRLQLGAFGTGGGGQPELVSAFNPAVYVATTCEESPLAWDPAASPATRAAQARAALAATPAAALAPFDRGAALSFGTLPLCGGWPAPTRVVEPPPPLPTTVPRLVLSGDLDLRTPLENARILARALHGRLVVEHGAGHAVLGQLSDGCASPAVEAFLAHRPPPVCRPRNAAIAITRRSAQLRPPALR
jgi:pimeloyl-ACP methyl ester carboxylesterase